MSKDLEKEFELVVDKIIRSAELISDEECVELKLEDLVEDFEHKKSTKPAWMEFLDTLDFNFFINNRQKYIDRVKDQDQKLADLEAKLAESEEERDSNYENYSICWKENTELKQQLAEKEKDKISFAVEQLEKVKPAELDYDDLIDLRNRIKECSDNDIQLYEEDSVTLDHILDYIEMIYKQIKQLKEGK